MVVPSAIQEAHWAMKSASVGTSAAAEKATSHMGVVGPTGEVLDGTGQLVPRMLVDGSGDSRTVGRHGRHDGRATAEKS